jgi:hypothetical protein
MHQIQYEVVSPSPSAQFVIYGVGFSVLQTDAILLLLMCLFRKDGLGWGEVPPVKCGDAPEPVLAAFQQNPYMSKSVPSPVHSVLAGLTSGGSA